MKKILIVFLFITSLVSAQTVQYDTIRYDSVNLIVLVPKGTTPPTPTPCVTCPPGKDGRGIVSTIVDTNGIMTVTYTDGTKYISSSLTGPPGKNPTISATATGVPYGTPVNVTQTGTALSPIFNFFIPEGKPGTNTGGGTPTNLPNVYVINPALGADSNPDSDAWQAAFNSAIATSGKVFIPAATNKWILDKTINIVGAQIFVDVEAYGRPGNISWRGGSNKKVFNIVGLTGSEWSGLNIEVQSGQSNVSIFDVDTSEAIRSSSFNHFHDMYLNFNAPGVVGFRFGFTYGPTIGGDISNWRIKNVVGYGPLFNPQPGTFLVQTLHGNVLANTLEDCFVAFCDGVFSNWAIAGSDRGGCFGTFKGIDTSQNICEFYFGREGTYPVWGGRMESSGMLMKTNSGTHNISAIFTGLRINDFKGNGVLMEINTPGTYKLDACHMHRQTNQSWTDMITLNGNGGFGTVKIEGGATRATNVVRKIGGATQWKVYIEGVQRWKTPNAVETEGWYPDQNGTQY